MEIQRWLYESATGALKSFAGAADPGSFRKNARRLGRVLEASGAVAVILFGAWLFANRSV